MFGIMRLSFWAALVLLIVPFGQQDDSANIDLASPMEAVSAVRLAVSDIAGICERQPELCEESRKLMSTLGKRAREGVRLAYQALDEHLGETEGVSEDPTTTGSVSK